MIDAILKLLEEHQKRAPYIKDKYYWLQIIHLSNKMQRYAIDELKKIMEDYDYE